jgi:hypothetical protein
MAVMHRRFLLSFGRTSALTLLALAVFMGIVDSPVSAQPNLPLQLPGPPIRPQARNPRIAQLLRQNARFPTFAAYRELVSIYLSLGLYDEVAAAQRTQAAMYRRCGLIDAAIIEEQAAARYDTKINLYLERNATPQEMRALYTGAPAEPVVGCYCGAFIDKDDTLRKSFNDDNWNGHHTPQEFDERTGKAHGSLFSYLKYGQKFPRKWVEACKQAHVIPQIAWEPANLNQVRDDDYLRSFARACAAADWPIFIRFASEMNGFWTPYHNNPPLYREKFRLMHKVLHSYAPRIATIWCVNNPPLQNIADYYPGDDGCDWVGINIYSLVYHDNNTSRPGLLDTPLALLDPIYKIYASRKPIAICEYAAAHRPVVDNKLYNDFAIQKMSLMYSALSRLYPRVKLIDWFDMNSIRYPVPGKILSDFTLTDQQSILDTYRRLVVAPYFLSEPQTGADNLPPLPRPIVPGQAVRGTARLSIWSSLALPGVKVYCRLGTRIIYASDRPGAQEVNLDLSNVPVGRQIIAAYAYDSRNRFVNSATATITVVK